MNTSILLRKNGESDQQPGAVRVCVDSVFLVNTSISPPFLFKDFGKRMIRVNDLKAGKFKFGLHDKKKKKNNEFPPLLKTIVAHKLLPVKHLSSDIFTEYSVIANTAAKVSIVFIYAIKFYDPRINGGESGPERMTALGAGNKIAIC